MGLMSDNSVFTILSTTDQPSLFQIARLARLTVASPALLLDVLDGLRAGELRIAMYCAEAVEKISRMKVGILTGYETEILTNFAMSGFTEVKGPLALVVPRLNLSDALKRNAVSLMFDCLTDDSSVMRERVFMALTQVSQTDVTVMDRIVPLLNSRVENGDRGEKARARDLLSKLSGRAGSRGHSVAHT